MEKDLVIGLGEIGLPIFKLFSKNTIIEGIDKNPKLNRTSPSLEKYKVSIMHICIPFTKSFLTEVKKLVKKFSPRLIVIHSTISPHTTEKLQNTLEIPVIYSATRGVHKRMLCDLKRYVKFYSIYDDAPN